MPLNQNDVLRITLAGTYQSQLWNHVWHYRVVDGTGGNGTEFAAEAFWIAKKTAYRSLFVGAPSLTMLEVVAERLAGDKEFSVFPIPLAEQQGTRTGVTGEAMPSFVAAGVKFNVANRLTRPGSKRVPGQFETDVVQNVLTATYRDLVQDWADEMLSGFTWLVQLDTVSVEPGVYGAVLGDRVNPVFNPFTGAQVNSNVTSQVSRKLGRGR